MGKRYYCDYCDRSFKDASTARKKHLTSLTHIKNKDEHYMHYKEPEKILQEELRKNVCQRFVHLGECQFENSCRYSHYTPKMLQHLKAIAAARAEAKKKINLPDLQKIIKEFFKDTIDPEQIIETDFNLWPLPSEIEHRPDLPPSLWPMSFKDFKSSNFPEWGWR